MEKGENPDPSSLSSVFISRHYSVYIKFATTRPQSVEEDQYGFNI